MHILSIKTQPEYKEEVIAYFQKVWTFISPRIYRDCISNTIGSPNPLPQWYLLKDGEITVGCAGLITNDFISRMDLYPWICALYIEPEYRGKFYSKHLIDFIKSDALRLGFKTLYLSTDHVGFYEKLGFQYIAQGYHPWGEESRIYTIDL